MAKKWYVCKIGRKPGIYETYAECEKQVKGFSGAIHKSFETRQDAENYFNSNGTESNKRKIETILDDSNKKHKFDSNESKSSVINSVKEDNKNNQIKDLSSLKSRNNGSKISNNLNYQSSQNHFSNNKNFSYLAEFEKITHSFTFDVEIPVVFTDGACSNNQDRKSASAGVGVFWGDDHPLNVSMKLIGEQTNNRAEITAAIVAITQAVTYGAKELKIMTDSQYMMDCIQVYIIKWKTNGWKTSGRKPVKNADEFKKLDELCSKLKINWEYVPGHKGHYGNEEADKLARKAIEKPSQSQLNTIFHSLN